MATPAVGSAAAYWHVRRLVLVANSVASCPIGEGRHTLPTITLSSGLGTLRNTSVRKSAVGMAPFGRLGGYASPVYTTPARWAARSAGRGPGGGRGARPTPGR
jgi:hypothetical protein